MESVASYVDFVVEGIAATQVRIFVGDFAHQLQSFEDCVVILIAVIDKTRNQPRPALRILSHTQGNNSRQESLLDFIRIGKKSEEHISFDIFDDSLILGALKFLIILKNISSGLPCTASTRF